MNVSIYSHLIIQQNWFIIELNFEKREVHSADENVGAMFLSELILAC